MANSLRTKLYHTWNTITTIEICTSASFFNTSDRFAWPTILIVATMEITLRRMGELVIGRACYVNLTTTRTIPSLIFLENCFFKVCVLIVVCFLSLFLVIFYYLFIYFILFLFIFLSFFLCLFIYFILFLFIFLSFFLSLFIYLFIYFC
jgi:hypothetical protein